MALINLKLGEEIPLIPDNYKIKAGGVFDLEELYVELQRWFEFNGYAWRETKYRMVEMPNGLSQIEIKWECEKQPVKGEYLTYLFKMHWQAFVSEIEVNADGVKKKMNKGSIELRFGGILKRNKKAFVPDEKDSKKRIFLKGGFGEYIWAIYDQFVIRKHVDYYKGYFFAESQKLFDEIKAFLQLYQ